MSSICFKLSNISSSQEYKLYFLRAALTYSQIFNSQNNSRLSAWWHCRFSTFLLCEMCASCLHIMFKQQREKCESLAGAFSFRYVFRCSKSQFSSHARCIIPTLCKKRLVIAHCNGSKHGPECVMVCLHFLLFWFPGREKQKHLQSISKKAIVLTTPTQRTHSEMCLNTCTYTACIHRSTFEHYSKIALTNTWTSATSSQAPAEPIVCRIDFLFNYQTSKLV